VVDFRLLIGGGIGDGDLYDCYSGLDCADGNNETLTVAASAIFFLSAASA
jgi:hypothetical protein